MGQWVRCVQWWIYVALWSSTLLASTDGFHSHRRASHYRYHRGSTKRMVLTTPEAIIEQASTTNLLDDLIDESVRTSARKPIMMQFDPSSGWLWRRWKGTIFSETWDACVTKMLYACAIFLVCRSFPQVKKSLSGFNILWGQLLSVTTFTLTFFVNQSYALWRKCSELSRRLQGRLHDLDMTLAAHAARKPSASPNEPSRYTAGARQMLELVSRYVRLFNLLTYASFTRSHRPILTPRGMRRLVERGLMTTTEREVLVAAELPATQRHNAILLWIIRAFVEGKEAGHFQGDAGFEQQFMEKAHVCRASYGAIGDELNGRMPLAYVHIVQVLVDMVLYMYPFMAISSGMSGMLCVLGTGILTLGYQGLFDLAKQFLDPYDNENYGKGEDPLVVDTLIAETNAGSIRWMNGLDQMPISYQRIKDGDLADVLLPVRGYSVDELTQMQEEKRLLQEQREREEAERLVAEEEARKVQEAAEAFASYQMTETEDDDSSAEEPYFIIYNNTGDRMNLEWKLQESPMATTMTITELIYSQNSNATSLQQELVPIGTAPASAFIEEHIPELPETPPPEPVPTEERTRIRFGGEDVEDDVDDVFHESDDWGDDTNYVHLFQGFDPYLDLPPHDEVGPDGREIRLSQQLADEVWEEEVEYEKMKEREKLKTYEDYIRRVKQLEDDEEFEMLETEEILKAGANSEIEEFIMKDGGSGRKATYDQTKLDSVSQLFGLPPDELSEIPSYVEPPLEEKSFDTVAQLWDTGLSARSSNPSTMGTETQYADKQFAGISQLWGSDFEDLSSGPGESFPANPAADEPLSASATRRVSALEVDEMISASATRRVAGDGGLRLSQMLADEVWEEEIEPQEEATKPFTFEDYERQVQELLNAEKEELIETAAILNARPGADGIEAPEKENDSGLFTNITRAEDELAVLEMDAPFVEEFPAGETPVEELGFSDLIEEFSNTTEPVDFFSPSEQQEEPPSLPPID